MTATMHPVEDLSAYADGALPRARADEIRTHVESCAACRTELARLSAATAALSRLAPAPRPSPDFAARLEARLAREPRPRRSLAARLAGWLDVSPLRFRLAAPAAAALLAGGVVFAAVRLQRAEEAAVAENLDLLLDYETVASVGEVASAEDAAVIAQLDELAPAEGKP